MDNSKPRAINPRSPRFGSVKWIWVSHSVLVVLVFCPLVRAQSTASSPSAPAACPLQLLRFDPSGVSVRIKNVSGKKIVGLVLNAALADATEHWMWLH